MKLRVELVHVLLNLTHHLSGVLTLRLLRGFLASPVRANVQVELSDLVRVLARRWDFNRAGPIEVEMTQGVCQMLQLSFGQRRVVLGHIKVSRQYTSLVGCRWR